MELDRQGIERRDFPIVRRGYDPASVDAHLKALSAEVEELQREASSRGRDSLASVAGTQVQAILEAAQATAADIEREAAEEAQQVRDQASEEARRTREEAVARAQSQVAAVAKATEELLARVGSMDSETGTLIDSLRAGASRLAGDLAAVETNMGALYDAATGRSSAGEGAERPAAPVGIVPDAAELASGSDELGPGSAELAPGSAKLTPEEDELTLSHVGQASLDDVAGGLESEHRHNGVAHNGGVASAEAYAAEPHPEPYSAEPHADSSRDKFEAAPQPVADRVDEPRPPARDDLDGARLVALNMALNGDSRTETGRYLDENFDIPDRELLLDEVYAAIEG